MQASAAVVDATIDHVLRYRSPATDLREQVRAAEARMLSVHAASLIANQAKDFMKQVRCSGPAAPAPRPRADAAVAHPQRGPPHAYSRSCRPPPVPRLDPPRPKQCPRGVSHQPGARDATREGRARCPCPVRQDGVTEIEESLEANPVERTLNDQLLQDEREGRIAITRDAVRCPGITPHAGWACPPSRQMAAGREPRNGGLGKGRSVRPNAASSPLDPRGCTHCHCHCRGAGLRGLRVQLQ